MNQLYYFATTPRSSESGMLRPGPIRGILPTLHDIDFLEGVCAALRTRKKPQSVFYPSSIFLEDCPRGMTGYCMAKAAGETAVRGHESFLRGINIIVSRLPRVRTDQTASVMPVKSIDPRKAMLPIVREMHAR